MELELKEIDLLLVLLRYGQMTAGSFCYIGPQGIVHGTTVRTFRLIIRTIKTIITLLLLIAFTCSYQ